MGRSIIGRSRKPAIVSTDTVIPFNYMDSLGVAHPLIDFTMRFDDVLDVEKLRKALERLMEIGEWKKLGARIRKNKKGKPEWHVPSTFTEERPGVIFTQVKHEMRIADHPLASRLPKSNGRPAVYGNPQDFRSLTRRPDAPKGQKDYYLSDEPQMSVHVVSFSDATLVTLRWGHWQMDAMGMSAILQAWSLVLQGRESEVPPFYGYDSDPLENMHEFPVGTAPEKYVLADKQLSGLGLLVFLTRYVFSLFARDEQRMLCIPSSHIAAWKATALEELNNQTPQPTTEKTELELHKSSSTVDENDIDDRLDEKTAEQMVQDSNQPFLSDGDIICAWWTKLSHRLRSKTLTSSIVVVNAFDFRKCFSADLLPPSKGTFVHNATGALFAFVPTRDLPSKLLGNTAAAIRQSIVSQGTRNQTTAFVALSRESFKRSGLPTLIAEPMAKIQVFSNWSKANVFQTDFSAAVIREGIPAAQRSNPLGLPSYVQAHGYDSFLRNLFTTFGKDAAGNYWCSPIIRASKWARIEKELADLPEMK